MDDEEDIEDFLLDSRLKLAVTKDNPTSKLKKCELSQYNNNKFNIVTKKLYFHLQI
jgi:hypothetical protein